jgi:hypothetical protein
MKFLTSLVLLLAAASQAVIAQEPPTRVGRLAYTEGSVALYQDPDLGWERAYVNSPLTSENSIWTDPGARAEMRVSGIALRLDEITQLDIGTLDENDLEAFLGQGSVAIRVRHFDNSERLDFATPHAQFRLYGNGRYRLDVDPDREETVLTVFTGSASMRSSTGDIRVATGAAIRVRGGHSPFFVRQAARTTAFDRWTLARDEKWIERNSTRYVSTHMTGYEDLDVYGEWYEDAEYGPIWFPSRVSRDWAPYRYGRWDWVRPWGWTWIAEEPWGYAPYHYGRWVYVRDRWGWYPGERVRNPVWAPALVAWVGGSNFRLGISTGPAVGWYPLAPWERYEPWYRTNTAYVTRLNRVVREAAPRQYRDRDRNEWRYANRDRGATVVRRDAFISGSPVNQAMVPVTREVIQQAQPAPATTLLPGREEFRRSARVATQPPVLQPGAPTTAQAPQPQTQERSFRRQGERAPAARPEFERRQAAPAPAPATAAQQQQPAQQAPAQAPTASPITRDDQRTRDRASREQEQAQERAAREQQQAQERAAREQQQAQERAAREQRQEQERAQRQAPSAAPASPVGRDDQRTQERAQREQQQAQERAQREAQQAQQRAAQQQQQQQEQQQRQGQERAQREQQQAQERAQREAQQAQQRAAQQQQQQEQQQRQGQERAQREQQQAQERAQREAQQAQQRAAQQQQQEQQQRQAQERAQREQQQAQERAQQAQQRAAQQQQQQEQQQRQAAERAQREAQQEQQRAAREAQQRAAQQPPPPQAAPQATPQAPPPAAAPAPAPEKGKGRDKDDEEKEKEKETEKEKGRGKGR